MDTSKQRPFPLSVPGYRLLELLGAGGMGDVYRAVQVQTGQVAAVKFLHARAPGEFVVLPGQSRPSRPHPNLITLEQAGECGGYPYLVMEYVAGPTLRERLRPGRPLPLDEARAILDAVAQGLSHLHAQGLLHLDLKPENILCGADGTVKIADLGLAWPAQGVASARGQGLLPGTLDYCPPEQRHGLPVDGRSDLFALATLAYELLTGRLPGRVYVSARQRNPLLPQAVDGVLRCALARDPDQRQATVEQFRCALNTVLEQTNSSPRAAGALAVSGLLLLVSAAAVQPGPSRTNHGNWENPVAVRHTLPAGIELAREEAPTAEVTICSPLHSPPALIVQ